MRKSPRDTHCAHSSTVVRGVAYFQLHLVVDMRGVAQRAEIEHARDRQPCRHLGMSRCQRIPAQSRRPTTGQGTLGETSEDFLAAALPIATVDMNETWRLRIIRRI